MDTSLIETIAFFIIFMYSVVLHEVAHGLMARSMGDTTAEDQGRLTLNPIKHLDMFGSVLLPLMLFLSRSPFLFGYAKPVPYNPRNLSDHRYGPAKVALAGPATNIALAVLAGLVIRLAGPILNQASFDLLGAIVGINLVLAAFNLMPVPPLDGHWLLMTFLPLRWHAFKVFLYRYQWLLLIVVLVFVFPLFFPILAWIGHLLTGVTIF